MFELKKKDVLLSNLTTRTEKFGDEDMPAVTLKLSMVMANSVLNQFHPDLLQSFYTRLEKNQADMIKDDLFPDLRFSKLKPLKWDEEYSGYNIRILDDLEPKNARFILADATLKKFEFEMQDGGSVKITFTVNCDPDGETVGWLYEMQKHPILMTIEPPRVGSVEEAA